MKIFFRIGVPAAAIMAVILGAGRVHAEALAPAPREQEFRHEKMAVVSQRLGLTDEQKATWRSLRSQTEGTVEAIRSDGSLSPEQKQAKITASRMASREQMRAMLTADQQAKLAQLTSHPRMLTALALHRIRMGVLARRLDLTPEQRNQIRAVQSKTRAAVKPIRADPTLTVEQKEAKLREIRQASRAEAHAVLTAEQQQKLERIRQRMLGPLG